MNKQTADFEAYFSLFPGEIQKRLKQMRSIIKKAAPGAVEQIKYGIPTFVLHGNLVHFGGFKNHIGFYATPSGHEKFEKELSQYKTGKGSVQFPNDKPLPVVLIEKIVKFRIKENEAKAIKKINK